MKKMEIIAEVAQGYEGNKYQARLLAKSAILSGAQSVKFQLIYVNEISTREYKYYNLFKSLEMPLVEWKIISQIVHKSKRKLYFDIYGNKSLAIAKKVLADGVKISTTEFYNWSLIVKAIKNFKKIFISIGGIEMKKIDRLYNYIVENKQNKKVCFLYGFQSEPAKINQSNLLKIKTFKERYNKIEIGFMDHTCGSNEEALYLSLILLGMNVTTIEKHITLDRVLQIEDYISGLSPEKFKAFVNIINFYKKALGSASINKLTKHEKEYHNKAAKMVVANKNLKKNTIIKLKDISLKRTDAKIVGKPIRYLENLIGKKLKKNIAKDKPILLNYI